MEANLHLHSRYSDGSLWPAEIAARAAASGLAFAAVTDHDSLGGVPEFQSAAAVLGLGVLPACEIDCALPELSYKSELLAYFPGAADPSGYALTDAFLRRITARRETRLKAFVERAKEVFRRSDLSFEELLVRKLGGRRVADVDRGALSFSKVDLYEYLKARGLVAQNVDYREFRRAYFDTGLFPDGRFPRVLATEVAEPILADGGVLVLPHPGHQFGDDPLRLRAEGASLDRLLRAFWELGVRGVELYWYHGRETEEINALVRKAAEPLGYFFTYGSDCHGPGSSKESLGDYSGDFQGFPGFAAPVRTL